MEPYTDSGAGVAAGWGAVSWVAVGVGALGWLGDDSERIGTGTFTPTWSAQGKESSCDITYPQTLSSSQ